MITLPVGSGRPSVSQQPKPRHLEPWASDPAQEPTHMIRGYSRPPLKRHRILRGARCQSHRARSRRPSVLEQPTPRRAHPNSSRPPLERRISRAAVSQQPTPCRSHPQPSHTGHRGRCAANHAADARDDHPAVDGALQAPPRPPHRGEGRPGTNPAIRTIHILHRVTSLTRKAPNTVPYSRPVPKDLW